MPPWLCRDRGFPRARPTARYSWGSQAHGLHPQQEWSALLLLPEAHPARWPGSRVWSRRSGRCHGGRVRVASPLSPPRETAGLGLLHCSTEPHSRPWVRLEGSRDPLCHPIPSSEPRRQPEDLWLPAIPPGLTIPLLQRRVLGCWMLHTLLGIPVGIPGASPEHPRASPSISRASP